MTCTFYKSLKTYYKFNDIREEGKTFSFFITSFERNYNLAGLLVSHIYSKHLDITGCLKL